MRCSSIPHFEFGFLDQRGFWIGVPTSTRATNDKRGLHPNRPPRQVWRFDALDKHIGGEFPDLRARLRNDSQSRFEEVGPFKVVETGERDIRGNTKAALAQRVHRPDSREIIARDNCRRRLRKIEKPQGGLDVRRAIGAANFKERFVPGNPVRFKPVSEALDPLGRRRKSSLIGNHSDSTMTV